MSLLLGGIGLIGFFWALKTKQYDDPKGDAMRILDDRYDDKPKSWLDFTQLFTKNLLELTTIYDNDQFICI